MMQGKRVKTESCGHLNLGPGEFGKQGGIWYACTPNGHMGNLSNHEVIEHDDETITVTPSIRVVGSIAGVVDVGELWHGHLKAGVWSKC